MESKASKYLESVERYLVYALIILFPLLFVNLFANAFVTPKLIVGAALIGLILLVKSLKVYLTGQLKFSIGKYDAVIFALVAIFWASSLMRTPNRAEAFFLPGTTTFVTIAALSYIIVNQLDGGAKKRLVEWLAVSASIVSLFVLAATVGIFESIPQLPAFMKQDGFSPLGGILPTLLFFVTIAPLAVGKFLFEKTPGKRVLYGVTSVLIILGAFASGFQSLPANGNVANLPSFSTSWGVAIDSVKESPALGVGVGNYLTAFNRFRPIQHNQTDLWNVRFNTSRSFFLTTMTETGLLGIATLLALTYLIFKSLNRGKLMDKGALPLAVVINIIALALFPGHVVLIFLFMILLAMSQGTKSINLGSATGIQGSKLPVLISILPVVLAVGYSSYYLGKLVSSEFTYRRALGHISRNEGLQSYNTLQAAIATSPRVDRYHATYAQINLALANSIANNENITDQDRTNITQLVQQAIREGQATIALNPTRAGNWELLGSIYRSIIPLAQGADQFAAQTYSQAVALDPFNPDTRIALGGLFFAAGNFENAIDIFELAVQTKGDHANAHYNLGIAYRENGKIDQAIQQMSIVLSLVERGSDDFELAQSTLQELQTRREQAQTSEESTANLTPPSVPTEPALEPQLELPEDAEPPEAPEVEGEADSDETS